MELKFTGGDVESVKGVVFHYSVNGVQEVGRAAPVGSKWQLTSNLPSGHYLVEAYAVYKDVLEAAHKTEKSRLDMSWSNGVARTGKGSDIPSRQIRAATIFRDDFNSFSTSNWDHVVSMYGGWNGEFQVYTNDAKNVFSRNGMLYVRPTLTVDDPKYNENSLRHGTMDMYSLYGVCTDKGNNGCHREGFLPPIMSGRINSKATMKYGTVEIRAQIPQGDWIWPAMWMLPKSSVYGQWPRSGEIDIMESRGNLGHLGVSTISSTLHWGPDASQNRFMKTNAEKQNYQSHRNWHADFHTWKLEWTPDHIITSIDGQQILNVNPGRSFGDFGGFGGGSIWNRGGKMAPFDQEFFLIFNVAVGGTSGFFPDGVDYYGKQKPWWNGSPKAAEDFWNQKNSWYPSWQSQGDGVSLIVDYVEMKTL